MNARSMLVAVLAFAVPHAGAAQDTRATSSLRVGSARGDVTLTGSGLPGNYLGVLDCVYARAIVL